MAAAAIRRGYHYLAFDTLGQGAALRDAAYAASTLTWARQTYEGRMDYSAVTTSTVRDLLGREPIHLSAWATAHRQELLDQLPWPLRQVRRFPPHLDARGGGAGGTVSGPLRAGSIMRAGPRPHLCPLRGR